jgi:hypothetical protein
LHLCKPRIGPAQNTCDAAAAFINIRTSFHTPRAKAAFMTLRIATLPTLRSTPVDGALRSRFEMLDRPMGIRHLAGVLA